MYKVHKIDIRMTHPEELEKFLNSLKGEIIAIVPNLSGYQAVEVNFVLVVEKT